VAPDFEVVASGVDESSGITDPQELVKELAARKAGTCLPPAEEI
jgi:predicted house-cleaning NTP pyrophosphatase (Maf/HAM1 superfamily)